MFHMYRTLSILPSQGQHLMKVDCLNMYLDDILLPVDLLQIFKIFRKIFSPNAKNLLQLINTHQLINTQSH